MALQMLAHAVLAGVFDLCKKSYAEDYVAMHQWAMTLLALDFPRGIACYLSNPEFDDPTWRATDFQCYRVVMATLAEEQEGGSLFEQMGVARTEVGVLYPPYPKHNHMDAARATWDGVIEWLPAMAQWRDSIPIQARLMSDELEKDTKWLIFNTAPDTGLAVGELCKPHAPAACLGQRVGPGAYLVVDLAQWHGSDGRTARVMRSRRGWPHDVQRFSSAYREVWAAAKVGGEHKEQAWANAGSGFLEYLFEHWQRSETVKAVHGLVMQSLHDNLHALRGPNIEWHVCTQQHEDRPSHPSLQDVQAATHVSAESASAWHGIIEWGIAAPTDPWYYAVQRDEIESETSWFTVKTSADAGIAIGFRKDFVGRMPDEFLCVQLRRWGVCDGRDGSVASSCTAVLQAQQKLCGFPETLYEFWGRVKGKSQTLSQDWASRGCMLLEVAAELWPDMLPDNLQQLHAWCAQDVEHRLGAFRGANVLW